MNDDLIKEALSYSLGSDLHEAWRAPRKKEDGTYENGYIPVRFRKDIELNDRTKIKIKSVRTPVATAIHFEPKTVVASVVTREEA